MHANLGLIAAPLAAAVLALPIAQAQQPPQFRERVNVARVMIDARVVLDNGEPVLGLAADDFRVRIDGKPAPVESATWVGEGAPARPVDAAVADAHRLTVFLFQKDLEPSRIFGLMRMLLKSRDFLQTLNPDDRVAILSFDSRLRIWTDFTRDRERLARVLGHDLLLGEPPTAEPSPPPSLLASLDPEQARKAFGIERALELIAEALSPLPGSKSLVLIGHGFGRLGAGGMTLDRDYGSAERALVASRTSVFSLDVTEADFHSLEAGLQVVSADTGGFYARTHVFPDAAMHRLAGALAGYYVLLVEKPERARSTHRVEVTIARGDGRVFAASRYAER